ncbi:MAG TPA: isoprenylcysteine carboxylmethyltransferase family protein [Gemmatimonadota bacterium]|nr:isoprenylcysteine carboxylmethyltransferase family protein [Gemmatimonadota bacterium]
MGGAIGRSNLGFRLQWTLERSMEPVLYFLSALLVLAAGYLIFRILVRRDYLRRGRLSPLSTLLEYIAIGLWAYHGYINRPADWPAIHVGPALRILGWVLFAGGVALLLIIILALGVRRSHGGQVSGLRQTGPYRFTRNPQALAFWVAMIGYGLLWPTWQHVGSVALIVLLTHMMVRTEEEHLQDVFGEEYERYRQRVPRYLGRPG